MPHDVEIHPDLMKDCRDLGPLRMSRLLLMDEAAWPWLVLVPMRPNKVDWDDLDPMDSYRVCDEIRECSLALKRLYSPIKINVAMLGNQVPQLHVHIIARFQKDPAWPRPVWGVTEKRRYDEAALQQRIHEIEREVHSSFGFADRQG